MAAVAWCCFFQDLLAIQSLIEYEEGAAPLPSVPIMIVPGLSHSSMKPRTAVKCANTLYGRRPQNICYLISSAMNHCITSLPGSELSFTGYWPGKELINHNKCLISCGRGQGRQGSNRPLWPDTHKLAYI